MVKRLMAAAIVAALPFAANASAIISDGNASLGVDTLGQLNVSGGVADVINQTRVGVRWIDPSGTQYESTSHGCECEGWGISVDGTNGFADNSRGIGGLTSDSFTSTATTAESVVLVNFTDVKVTHTFQLSASDDLYEVIVKIENTGTTDVGELKYRRQMDWDTSPTPFNEYVTIGGTGTTTLLETSSTNGFIGGNFANAVTDVYGCGGVGIDYNACGPKDHGAVFDFNFGALAAGETREFSIFYGGAANKAAADAALGIVGAELFSYGWSGSDVDQDGFHDVTGAITPTFIFAFKGVGGTVVVPPPSGEIPLPAGAWLMLAGLGALGAVRRRQKKAA